MTEKASRSSVVSSYTIIKGAMIEDTYKVFQGWDFGESREVNLARVRETNSIGAKTSAWLIDVYKVLHRRFDPSSYDRCLVELAQANTAYDIWKPLLLWHMTRDEFLFRDFLINWLFECDKEGVCWIRNDDPDLEQYLRSLKGKGYIEKEWSESTLNRVTRSLMKMSCDFGLLKGSKVREFESYYLPEESFLYILHAMKEKQANSERIVSSLDWRMFLMSEDKVENELLHLHQLEKLHYQRAGTIVELELPCDSAAAYIREYMI